MEPRVLVVVVVVLHCLGTSGQVLVMLLIALKAIILGLSNTWHMRTVWNANLSWICICWNQCYEYRFKPRFGLPSGTEYFGTSLFRRIILGCFRFLKKFEIIYIYTHTEGETKDFKLAGARVLKKKKKLQIGVHIVLKKL